MSLIDDLVKLEEEAKELVAGADDAAKLEAARVELLGRKGRITGLMRMMGKLAPEDRPMMGKRANEMRQLIEGMLDERTTEMKAAALKHALEHEAVDITLPGIRRIFFATCSARAAKKRSVSASSVISSPRSIARIFSPSGVPPGSRVRTTSRPASQRYFSSALICVDLPAPSIPSNVMKRPNGALQLTSVTEKKSFYF